MLTTASETTPDRLAAIQRRQVTGDMTCVCGCEERCHDLNHGTSARVFPVSQTGAWTPPDSDMSQKTRLSIENHI